MFHKHSSFRVGIFVTIFLLSSFFMGVPAHAQQDDSQSPLEKKCQLERDTAKNTCLQGKLTENHPDITREDIASCSVQSTQAYNSCKGGQDTSTEENKYQVADASSLNQFAGLTIQNVIGNGIATAMKILGSIAFAIMVFAGFMWMTAGGNSDKSRKSMEMMIWAALGVVVILSSYTIVKFVLDAFTN